MVLNELLFSHFSTMCACCSASRLEALRACELQSCEGGCLQSKKARFKVIFRLRLEAERTNARFGLGPRPSLGLVGPPRTIHTAWLGLARLGVSLGCGLGEPRAGRADSPQSRSNVASTSCYHFSVEFWPQRSSTSMGGEVGRILDFGSKNRISTLKNHQSFAGWQCG